MGRFGPLFERLNAPVIRRERGRHVAAAFAAFALLILVAGAALAPSAACGATP